MLVSYVTVTSKGRAPEDDAVEGLLLRGVHFGGGGGLVHDEAAEAGALLVVALDVVELVQGRFGSRVPQQVFRGHDHQRFAELAVHLQVVSVGFRV